MAEQEFLVIGEALVDLISDAGSWRFEAAPGGSPLNVAVGLAAAGRGVRLASEVGDDLFGGMLREHLRAAAVASDDLATTAATSLAFARVDESGEVGYDFRFRWDWSGPTKLAGVRCLHTGSLAALIPPGAEAVAEAIGAARQRGVTVSYDPNIRPSLVGEAAVVRRRVERLVAAVDIVKVSAEDLAWLYPGTPDLVAARRWSEQGPGLVVVTRGGGGAVALQRGYAIECSAPQVTVVDTVGAGDAFTAGLLATLARSGALSTARPADVEAALRHGTATAAAVCARRGATPAPAAAVAALLPATAARVSP